MILLADAVDSAERWHVLTPFIFSIIVLAVPCTAVIFQTIIHNLANANKHKKISTLSKKLAIVSVFLILSVFFQRASVLCYGQLFLGEEKISFIELVITSILRALQTISMNEDYHIATIETRNMLSAIIGNSPLFLRICIVFSSFVNLFTPIAGGAIIFEVLTAVFPKLKWMSSFCKKQYYFSELNERSLALAKSILSGNKCIVDRPVIIFTDTYIDDGNEEMSELIAAAKGIGAICISDDLLDLHIRCLRKKYVFLIDDAEIDNIKTLANLAKQIDCKSFKNTEIYVFYQDDSYVILEQNIIDVINEKYKKEFKKQIEIIEAECKAANKNKKETEKAVDEFLGKEKPIIDRVRYYENLIFKLLKEIPLITPIIDKKDSGKELNVTVFGSGFIGKQMVLSSSWAGQIYGYNLAINVISQESKDEIKNVFDNAYPEFLESTKPNSTLLKIFDDDEKRSSPYFTFRYCSHNFQKGCIKNIVCEDINNGSNRHEVYDSDYYLVALGSDEMNISVAEQLQRKIAIEQQTNHKKIRNVVIVAIVYDSNLCEAFNAKTKDISSHITTVAFGSMDEIYDFKTIAMINEDSDGKAVAKKYLDSIIDDEKQTIRENKYKSYNAWSSLARAYHLYYRVFSAYSYMRDNNIKSDWNDFVVENESALKMYYENVLDKPAVNSVYRYLSWLEHRRWNAYLRSIGFSAGDSKNLKLKLHNCLVETKPYDEFFSIAKQDLLDKQPYDVKKYDTPKMADEKVFVYYTSEKKQAQNKPDVPQVLKNIKNVYVIAGDKDAFVYYNSKIAAYIDASGFYVSSCAENRQLLLGCKVLKYDTVCEKNKDGEIINENSKELLFVSTEKLTDEKFLLKLFEHTID